MKSMSKYTSLYVILLCLTSGCWGYSSRNNELTGQVKYVERLTPMFCDDRTDADISLGVMRKGVGSMSTQDVVVYVPSDVDARVLTTAAESGQLVKIKYDEQRFSVCKPLVVVRAVTVLKEEPSP